MTVRTRFAPSPTGYLHVGGVRTALYSWLYARKHKGVFILRIEDTDKERSTKESIDAILNGMAWLGLNYDEGPFYQSERMDRYAEVVNQLLDQGHAYRCYCSKERLETLRLEQQAKKEKPRYDGCCRDKQKASQNQPHVVRFRNPKEGEVSFEDSVHGRVTFQNSELDDLIIARSDGVPTYNLTAVVDDIDMKITHVIRGNDHVNNTPRQINILRALGATLPIYTHVPMILGHDGKRLSKRHGAVNIMQYRDDGYLPEAMLNYLVRLGWSHGDQEIFSVDEMIEFFDVKHINKAAASFNFEKLLWLNHHYIMTKNSRDIADKLKPYFDTLNVDITYEPKLEEIVEIQSERCKTLKEMAGKSAFFYRDVKEYEPGATRYLNVEGKEALRRVRDGLTELNHWESESIHQIIIRTAETLGVKLGKVAQPIRIAVSGSTVSPPIDVTLKLLGKERVLERLSRAIDAI